MGGRAGAGARAGLWTRSQPPAARGGAAVRGTRQQTVETRGGGALGLRFWKAVESSEAEKCCEMDKFSGDPIYVESVTEPDYLCKPVNTLEKV